jgi:acyl carrier protein
VKLRGMRIELEEIENLLLQHPSVQEAVAVKREIPGNEFLAAYIIKNNQSLKNKESLSGEETWVSQLKAYLSGRLPGYMVPARIIDMETFPRKPNGKIDYDSLPDQLPEQAVGDNSPRSDIQKKLAKIWWEILGVEHIGVNTRFFEAGGNSLNAMSLMAKIRKEFNIKISLREVFNNPTINHQEEIIKKQAGEKHVSLEPTEKKEHYPLSSQQKRIYFFQQIDDKSIIYNINHAYELEGDFNRERLENILGKLTRKHESLRTSFESINGEPVQRIHDEAKFTGEYFENCKDENQIKGVIKNFIRPFDLTKAPLLRVGLIKMEKEKHILITDIHHIIADGVSIAILMEEFSELYDGEERSPLELRYKDYSNWQNSKDYKDRIKKQEQFWMGVFSYKSPILDLPVDYPRNLVIHESEEKILWFEMDNELTKDLRRMLTQKEVTLYMILLAVYNVLLSKYCAQEDIVVGTAVSGRTHDDLRNIMGIFVNMLPLRNYPKGDKTFSQFLEEVKQNTLDALNNQDYPFEMLISRLNLDRDMKRNPLFDTVFQVQNLSIAKREIKGLTITPNDYELRVNPSRYELVFTAMEGGDNIHFKFQYSRQLYKKETIVAIYEHYINILKTVLQDDGVKLIDIELDSGVQRAGMDMEKEEAANKIGLESKIDFGF